MSTRNQLSELAALVDQRREEIERAWNEHFYRDTMWVELDDGRSLGVPLAWFPRLMRASAEQRENYRIGYSGNGLHWDDLNEDISVDGLLMGRADETGAGSQAA